MSKKLICLVLALIMAFTVVGCRATEAPAAEPATETATEPATDAAAAPEAEKATYKIGIITGTVSQGEEEFQQAQNMKAKYGDMIVTATYPDNFSTETETTIAQVVGLASDPEVKAIVFVQAVPGAAAAIDKVRETRPEMLFVCGVIAEDPAVMASKADICLLADELTMGDTLPALAAQMGAKTYIHYSFARHLSYATIAARRLKMIDACEKLGIEFVDVTAPDPTGDAGVAGAQQFILEDVPQQVAKYGKDTAFFSTNCAMQEPLIRSVAEQGAIYPQQCCPSPYHGYPAALGIDVTGHEGDVEYMLASIKEKLDANGQAARMSTWTTPVNMAMVEGGVLYAIEFCEGRTNGRIDAAVLETCFKTAAGEGCKLTTFNEGGVTLDNFFMVMGEYYNFATQAPYVLEF
ncbi:MAG: hypothetical protein C0413_01390 [Clostridiales bacterium]|nr:hypothetical protein [Clostridiales bacterium]